MSEIIALPRLISCWCGEMGNRRSALVALLVLPALVMLLGTPRPVAAASGCNTGMPIEDGGTSPALIGPLVVIGNQVCDSGNSNAQVILKGINRGGGDYLPNGVTSANLLSPAEVDAMNSVWHADYVRLFVSADLVNKAFTGTGCVGETGAYDPQYKNKVVAAVNEAEADHMLISLTIGRTNPNCYWNSALVASEWCPLQNPPCSNGWTGGLPLPMPGQDVATALSALSQYFSNTSLYPLVAFELYNEPHVCVTSTGLQGSGSGSCSQGESADADAWANGGTVNLPVQSYTALGMSALASTVRSKTNDLLLIDANYFSQDAGSFSHLTAISNASYVFHYYTCQAAGQCTSTQESCATNASALGDDFGAADVQANPVLIDEFGWPQGSTGSDGIEMENVASFVSNAFLPGYLPNGLVYPNDAGWAAFQWGGPNDNGTGTWSLANETGGYTPNDNGVPVEDAMNGSYPSPCT